ncbi:MAG: hypothetical protein HQL76_17460 [Magnetococcales bacterium]|nr:hypothetical protein [Magnetococcales bacterium]
MENKKKTLERLVGMALNVQTMLDHHGHSMIALHIDGRYVEIEFSLRRARGNEIREGDRVIVVGHPQDERFKAIAYVNATLGTSATVNMIRNHYLFGCGFMTLAGGLLFSILSGWKGGLIRYSNEELAIAAIMFFFASMIFFMKGRLIDRAKGLAVMDVRDRDSRI